MSDDEPGSAAPLARREPRPLLLHWAVASAVSFLALAVATSFFGAALSVIAIVSIGIGFLIAPFSRRAERRALAARR